MKRDYVCDLGDDGDGRPWSLFAELRTGRLIVPVVATMTAASGGRVATQADLVLMLDWAPVDLLDRWKTRLELAQRQANPAHPEILRIALGAIRARLADTRPMEAFHAA